MREARGAPLKWNGSEVVAIAKESATDDKPLAGFDGGSPAQPVQSAEFIHRE